MPKPKATRAGRARAALIRMPHVPPVVAERIRQAFEADDFPERGVFAAMEAFFAHLAREERALDLVRPEDFRTVATSRTRLRVLLWSLRTFCPEAPLAPAAEVVKEWDHWLNSCYNVKLRKPRKSTRVALPPDEWPEVWQAALPDLDRSIRIGSVRYRPLQPKTRASTIQAVGMMAAARDWAAAHGVVVSDAVGADLIEIFARFLLADPADYPPGRGITPRSAADYLERVRGFVTRARLIDEAGHAALTEIVGALREAAGEADPGKRTKVQTFRRRFTLADVMLRAVALADEADRFPGHGEAAARLRREAVILALLVNTGDRQGDLSRHRIGIDLVRRPDELWELAFFQSKTARLKDNGPLWPVTSRLLDRHILADRPDWVLPDRLDELHGLNAVSLREEGMDLYYPTKVLHREFGISGHLVRTLIVDAIRISHPDAGWAAQFLLGHGTREMQEEYRTDFREVAAIRKYHNMLDDVRTQGR